MDSYTASVIIYGGIFGQILVTGSSPSKDNGHTSPVIKSHCCKKMLMLTSNKISYFSLVQAGLLTIIAVSFLVSFGAESVADES